MSWVSKAIRPLLENVNGLTFLGGACWVYAGLRHFSPGVADIVAGIVVMAIGAFPYMQRRKRKV